MDEADVMASRRHSQKRRVADEYVTRILYKTRKPVILAVNKVDNRDAQ